MSSGRLARLSILLVDDNHHMASIIRSILRGFGIKDIHDASDTTEAFNILQCMPIDIVLTDYSLAPMNGLDFTRQIRTADDSPNPYLPVIMLTAYSERSMVERARDAGVTEFCAKPVTARNLYRKVSCVVNKPRPFIQTPVFFGPDRRRRPADGYDGVERRHKQSGVVERGSTLSLDPPPAAVANAAAPAAPAGIAAQRRIATHG